MDIFEKFPKEIADKFLIPDNIDPVKFVGNWYHYYPESYMELEYEIKEIKTLLPANPTSSCFDHLMDLPLGHPSWFAAAYPDVIRYFATPPCENKEKIAREFESIFESIGLSKEDLQDPDKFLDNPKITDKEGFFRPDFLYQIKECYKKLNPGKKLECQ